MTTEAAIVVVTIHAGSHSRAIFGPFANGDEASRWGFQNFPNNTAPDGSSVTWCWEHLIPQTSNVFDAIVSNIDGGSWPDTGRALRD